MPQFNLSGQVTVSAYTKVIAKTLEEAIEMAAKRDAVLGGTGSGSDENEEWIVEDVDGSIENIHAA